MRRIGLSLALLFAFSPAVLAQTAAQAPVAESASAADVDRLLQAMDMKTMMAGMMQQMQGAQEKMLADAFGADLDEAKRARMQEAMATSSTMAETKNCTSEEDDSTDSALSSRLTICSYSCM